MARIALCILAKEPLPGTVKTRLAAVLGDQAAADCHAAFLTDSLARLATVKGTELVLAGTAITGANPEGDRISPSLAALADRFGARLAGQGEGDLGARMATVLGEHADGRDGAILFGADTPDLPLEYVADAVAALEHADVVLGPAADGGYYLVGAREPLPEIFPPSVIWGGPTVMVETIASLAEAGRTASILPTWSDVDEVEDLRALAKRLGWKPGGCTPDSAVPAGKSPGADTIGGAVEGTFAEPAVGRLNAGESSFVQPPGSMPDGRAACVPHTARLLAEWIEQGVLR